MLDLPLTWVERYLYPPLFVTVLWCVLTLGLLWINRRGQRVARIALALTFPLLVFAHWQLFQVRNDISTLGAYTSCGAALIIWSWHELAFYSGVITGIWRQPCPATARGGKRFVYALSTHIYHELAAALEVILLAHLHVNALNVVGPLTFVLLWALLHSAKLNVFLGVRNLTLDWLPTHLQYLGSFWRQRPYNPLMIPLLILFVTLAGLFWFWGSTLSIPGQAVSSVLLATFATLGVLENWLLILPLGSQQKRTPAPQRWGVD